MMEVCLLLGKDLGTLLSLAVVVVETQSRLVNMVREKLAQAQSVGLYQGADKPDCADSSSRLQTEALAAAWLAALPSLTMAQLLKHMDPSQPAAVKAAAARELARRLDNRSDKDREQELAAFEASPEGVSRLVQLLTDAAEHDTQLAALAALGALWRWCSSVFLRQQLAKLPGFADTLVRLLHELPAVGDEAVQADWMRRVAYFLDRDEHPQALSPSSSNPNSWPVASAFVAVLQAPAVSAQCKGRTAYALYWLVVCNAPSAAEHPAVQAAVGPLVALLEDEDVQYEAARAIYRLADGHPANQSLIGAEPGAINRLWQLGVVDALAAVVKVHGINQSRLIPQDGFMDELIDLLTNEDSWRFTTIAAALSQDNPEFILRLCNTSTAVPLMTRALRPETYWYGNGVIMTKLALLLSICKARPSTIHAISSQSGVTDKLQVLSNAKTYDGKQCYPDATRLLQLVRLLN